MRLRVLSLLLFLGLLLTTLPASAREADEVDEATAAEAVNVLLEEDPGADIRRIWDLGDALAKGGKAAITGLREAAADASPGRCLAIARALILLEDHTKGLELLEGVVRSDELEVPLKVAALRVIGDEGELEEAKWLEDRIDVTHNPRVKMAVAKALWRLDYRNKRKGKEVLLRYLRSTDADLRAEGALALGEIGAAAEARPILLELSDEPTERGRSAAFLLTILNLEQQAEQALRAGGSPDGTDADPAPATEGHWPLLDEIVRTLEQAYLETDAIDRQALEDAMAGGITKALDPFTAYLTPEENAEFQEGLDPTYGGVGAYVFNDANNLKRFTISRPIWGGPVYRAGLCTGDVVMEIAGRSTEGLGVDECVRLLKGPPGTDVTVRIFRPGWTETRSFTLTRARITIPTTAYDILPGKIGVLEILSFSQDTAAEVAKILGRFEKEGVKGIVIDVRYNGGGYLQSAVEIVSQFLPEGKLIVTEKGRPGGRAPRRHESTGAGVLQKTIPVVVLINQGTASAAEILAGALRTHERARLVGTMSFGKGSVQSPCALTARPGEPFTDMLRDVPVRYSDHNGNGRHDVGEPVHTETLRNGRYDPPERFEDANGNGRYDDGESFIDDNMNGRWDAGESFTDENANGIWDPGGLLKLTIGAYYLPDGRFLKRETEVVDGEVVVKGGLEPDVEAKPEPLDYWELQAQRALNGSPELKTYVDGVYADHRDLAERLARSDGKDPSRYPGFDAFYESLDTRLDKDAVRFLVRLMLRRHIGDDIGRELVGDVVDDPVLQAALQDLFRTLGRDLEDVEDLAFLAHEAEEDVPER